MNTPSSEAGLVNLSSMTKAQLKSYAAEQGIEVDGGLKKADLIAAIEKAII